MIRRLRSPFAIGCLLGVFSGVLLVEWVPIFDYQREWRERIERLAV